MRCRGVLSLAIAMLLASPAVAQDADPGPVGEDRVGLADLAAYRAALSGRPTADDARPSDPPARVGFRELWDHPETYRGRRVTVSGRLERTFRQGAVGSFPPLAESWIFSPSGDPLCIVYPRSGPAVGGDPPGPGRPVRFTGTFLKTVRYAAGNGERLAPLIVGDRPPERPPAGVPAASASGAGEALRALGGGGRRPAAGRHSRIDGGQALGLALAAIAALVIAGQHLRGAWLRHHTARRRRIDDRVRPDPPLQFVDPPEKNPT